MSTPGTGSSRPHIIPQDPCLRDRDRRLDSLKAVIGRLAHDFNNALVPVLGYISLAKEDIEPGTGAANFVTAAENGARKMERHLDTILLAVFPHRKFKTTNANLKELVQAEAETCRQGLAPGSNIEIKFDLEDFRLALDPYQWRIVLQNVMRNACRAMPNGGAIRISLRQRALDAASAEQMGVLPGPFCLLTITDDGAGMAPDVLDRCLEPFYSSLPKSKAAGLGLTALHSICRLHGGQCRISSQEGKGSTLEVWLPVAIMAEPAEVSPA